MNIYDIADKAGVSIATVSRVINGSKKVSLKTRMLVQQIMEENHYIPNQIAIGLATNRSGTLGVMVPDVRDPFHAEIAYLLEHKMVHYGYNCILCNTSTKRHKQKEYLETLHGKNAEGIILVGSSYHDSRIHEIYAGWDQKLPIVMINAISGEGTASVVCDEAHGISCALKHLKSIGRKYPILIKNLADGNSRASLDKELAFKEGIKETFSLEGKDRVQILNPTQDSYMEFLKQQIEHGLSIDSALLTNDMSAAIFMKALERMGLSIPGQIAVIGANNSPISVLTSPAITTIDNDMKAICKAALEKLLKMIQGEEIEKITYVSPKLVIRESTLKCK